MNYIINADDFGCYNDTNNKIEELLVSKYISQTTLMITYDAFLEDALNRINTSNLQDKVGLHVSLTRGYPLSQGIKNTPLFSGNWLLINYLAKPLHFFWISKKIKKAIYEEIDSQMKRYKEYGLSLLHFDSHGNVHCYPSLYKLFIKAGISNGFRSVRIPFISHSENFIIKFLKRKITRKYKKHFKTTELNTFSINELNIITQGCNSFEIMSHPKNTNNEDEIIKKFVHENGYPISFKEL